MQGDGPRGWATRLAADSDIPAIEALIPRSARALQSAHYSREQIEAALGPVFAVDRQLILDRTYLVVEDGGLVVGCGGWSRRKSLFGGERGREGPDLELDPAADPARVRAFFVHPDRARRGIGRSILAGAESAMRAAGFLSATAVATLAGEPLYAAFGYRVVERYDIPLAGGLALPAVRMAKDLSGPV
jgi:N-acetylglutamate synthase-like GNAT family acetyltransferase